MLLAISANKGCHGHQASSPYHRPPHPHSESEGTQDGDKQAACCHAPSHCRSPTVSPEGTQDGREQDTGPRQLRCISKEWLPWAQTLASSQIEKSTKFIDLLSWFFFFWVNSNLFKFWLPVLFCKIPIHPGSSLTCWESNHTAHLRT